jgi:hypothetical protein
MYYNLISNFYMHSYVDKKFHSCKKWVFQKLKCKMRNKKGKLRSQKRQNCITG